MIQEVSIGFSDGLRIDGGSMVFPDTSQDLPDDKARAGSHLCWRGEALGLLRKLATSNPQIRCWFHGPSMMLRNQSREQPNVHVENRPWWSSRTSKPAQDIHHPDKFHS